MAEKKQISGMDDGVNDNRDYTAQVETTYNALHVKSHMFGYDGVAGFTNPVNANSNGQLFVTNPALQIATGELTGITYVHKFGSAPNFDTGDLLVTIWDGADDAFIDAMNLTYSTTADIDTISSSDNSDTQLIEIQGLDANWNLVKQTKTLTGTTEATLDTPLLRVFRMKNLGATDNAGHIYVYVNDISVGGVPALSTDVRAIMQPGNNQTLMASYTIPNGKKGYLTSFYAGNNGAKKSSDYEIELRLRPTGGVFQIKHLSSLFEDGISQWNYMYQVPEPLAAKTDIEMRGQALTAAITEATLAAGFDLILVDD